MSDIFYRFFHQNRVVVVGHIALTLLTFPLEMLLLSYISGLIFQRIKDKRYRAFYSVLVGFFFAFLLIQFLHFSQDYMSSLIIPRLDTFTRTELLDAMLNHRFEEDELKVGELMHRMSKTPGHLYKHYSNVVNYLVPLCFSAVFFTGYLFWIHWKMGLLVTTVLLLLFVIYFYVFFLLARDAEWRLAMEYGLMDGYEDTIANWESIRLTSMREQEKKRMADQSADFERKQQQDIHRVNVLKIGSIVAFNLLMLALLGYGIYLSTRHKLFPYWKLIVLITAILLMSKTMTSLLVKSSDSIYHAGSVQQLKEFMARFQRDPVDSKEGKVGALPPKEMDRHKIVFDHVSYAYPGAPDTPVLRDVTLRIPFPSSVLILGAIGSGKSTLVKMLMGYYRPTTGSVTVDGVPVQDYPSAYLLRHITYMNQSVLLFNRTVLENIFYGQSHHDREGLEALRPYVPARIMDHLDDVVGKQGNMLSGGERQVVLLLRTYFKPNPVVLLDEPTANLDPVSKKSAEDIIRNMMKQKTVVCITHDPGMVPLFQHVYRLEDGVLSPR